jgi:hypothetical protein
LPLVELAPGASRARTFGAVGEAIGMTSQTVGGGVARALRPDRLRCGRYCRNGAEASGSAMSQVSCAV